MDVKDVIQKLSVHDSQVFLTNDETDFVVAALKAAEARMEYEKTLWTGKRSSSVLDLRRRLYVKMDTAEAEFAALHERQKEVKEVDKKCINCEGRGYVVNSYDKRTCELCGGKGGGI